jgi:hypothetical protein
MVSVSNATWASTNGGQVTLTLASVPPLANEGEYHYITGQFIVSGAGAYNGTYSTSSSSCTGPGSCTVTFSAATNPGTYGGGGTFTWPLIRQFNESVYTLDNGTNGTQGRTAMAARAAMAARTPTWLGHEHGWWLQLHERRRRCRFYLVICVVGVDCTPAASQEAASLATQ